MLIDTYEHMNIYTKKEVTMAMVKLLISVPKRIKVQLDVLRKEGTSASGFIRNLLEKEFKHRKDAQS